MRKLVVFNSISLDGYFVDQNGDMSWAHNAEIDEEWNAFVAANARGGGLLIFGRITYDLMKSFWPTPAAMQADPVVAERMNNLPKIVISRTLDQATWNNTRLIKDDMVAEVRKLKNEGEIDMVIMGSGTIIAQLAQARLIDEYQMVMVPVILGQGRTMFEGLEEKQSMKLASSRTFNNGNVLLSYVLVN